MSSSVDVPESILDPGMCLTLRPMRYPVFFEMFKDGIKNTWTVEEVDFSTDLVDLKQRLTPAEIHLIQRLVAFFATGDSIVSNNLVLNLYTHINSPEARLYLSRQLYEEAVHVQFYLTLLDNYIPEPSERAAAFAAVENIPSISKKADFCLKWMDSIQNLDHLETDEDRRNFLLNLICFACCIEGLFFFAAFAYVYFLRSRGLLHGLAAGTNWVFRDESAHLEFAFEVVNTVREQNPGMFDDRMKQQVIEMMKEAVDAELQFSEDLLSGGVAGLSPRDMREYLQYVADQRLERLGIGKVFGSRNPFPFMELQDVQELTNFFERRVSAYQVAVEGEVAFHAANTQGALCLDFETWEPQLSAGAAALFFLRLLAAALFLLTALCRRNRNSRRYSFYFRFGRH
jgi:ribonucleoside-diphosphate reductase beta chain